MIIALFFYGYTAGIKRLNLFPVSLKSERSRISTLWSDCCCRFRREETFQDASYEYARMVQKPKQSVKELAEVIRKIVGKMAPDVDNNPQLGALKLNLMYSKFLEALRSDIRIEIIKFGLIILRML